MGDTVSKEVNTPNRVVTVVGQGPISETVWTDDSARFFVRVNQAGVISWFFSDGSAAPAPNGTGHPV
jgi:hypothetical protein